MTDKKKKYLTPEMKVVVLDQADIICTSDTVSAFSIEENAGYSEEDW